MEHVDKLRGVEEGAVLAGRSGSNESFPRQPEGYPARRRQRGAVRERGAYMPPAGLYQIVAILSVSQSFNEMCRLLTTEIPTLQHSL